MRRLMIPVKTSAVTVLLLTGAMCVVAEARQEVKRRQQLELAQIENSVGDAQPSASGQSSAISAQAGSAVSAQRQTQVIAAGRDEPAAAQQTSQLLAPKSANRPDGHKREIVISIPDRRLALLEDGYPVKFYRIAVGTRRTPSPEGDFQIINHAKDPTYRHNGKEIAPGKDNPLGDRWMGLSLKGYGIHGTNMPYSIGKAASHGCFRMAKEDVEDLYGRVHLGDAVSIHRRRDETIAQIFGPAATESTAVLAAKTTNSDEVQVASAGSATPASTDTQQ